jgi:hypothetical protein
VWKHRNFHNSRNSRHYPSFCLLFKTRRFGDWLYYCCWCSSAQSFTGLSPARLMTVFYCLRFEIQPTWRARSPVFRSSRDRVATVNYRPVLSSEWAPQNKKQQLSKGKSQGERKIGRGSQMGAWRHDGLADWLSVVMWLWLWLWWPSYTLGHWVLFLLLLATRRDTVEVF